MANFDFNTIRNKRILITGATGFLGKRLSRLLEAEGIYAERTSLSLGVDLRNYNETYAFFHQVQPDLVFNCASFVGGIQFGYKYPADLFENNLLMNVNLLRAARETAVGRIVNPISNCVYPAKAMLFKEDEIWDGPMHDSVMVYGFVRKAFWVGSWANAKQYGLDVINIVLSNMYGPEDHFEEERSHALGALIMKFVEAKRTGAPYVTVWGSGKPVREWMHVDDGAEAMIRASILPATQEFINVGIGEGISVWEMSQVIKELTGYNGEIRLDTSKPDGAAYKTVDGSRGFKMMGWQPSKPFYQGVAEAIQWYERNQNSIHKTNKHAFV
ncbi:MAG TPA: NAD-dependent epimerase/dehydratase family protein [Saprospiraceae bacterium]|nr:NAD-dependent epimerase/dehydratase family protein [Saprospiraceae bacterium]HRV84203.1 NAD-dependent epimerase/dehydratase family protein [Saprospiraceae bacterium]